MRYYSRMMFIQIPSLLIAKEKQFVERYQIVNKIVRRTNLVSRNKSQLPREYKSLKFSETYITSSNIIFKLYL